MLCVCVNVIALRLQHIVLDSAPPMQVLQCSTYLDEDMVGRVKQFALRSHPKGMGRQILLRYAAYVCCSWLRSLGG